MAHKHTKFVLAAVPLEHTVPVCECVNDRRCDVRDKGEKDMIRVPLSKRDGVNHTSFTHCDEEMYLFLYVEYTK